MSLLVTLLTIVIVIDCVILILLILMQLPKKEAGLGQAFGGSATDALFGAGSGNVLTKATKYAAFIFFALAVMLAILGPRANAERQRRLEFEQRLGDRQGKAQPPPPGVPPLGPSGGLKTLTNLATGVTNLEAPTPPMPTTNTNPPPPK